MSIGQPHRTVEHYYREGCICSGGWPKRSDPVVSTSLPRSRAERRARARGVKTGTTTTFYRHIHSPECEAAWMRGHSEE